MTAQRLVENCVLTNQTAVVDEMLNKNLLPEEYIYGMVAYRQLVGRPSETRGRSYHRGIRLLLVGQVSERAGNLHG